MAPMFEIENLHASIEDKEILKGVDLTIGMGEIHALMGPNGSGKSTLANVLAGHPSYEVTEGSIRFMGEEILELDRQTSGHGMGIFLAFQYPTVIPGVSMANFLRMAVTNVRNARAEKPRRKRGAERSRRRSTPRDFRRLMKEKMAMLKMDDAFATRYLNEGFSGGEKKRAEILQMALLEPTMAILDETDSGLDIDALRVVSEGVNALAGPDDMGVLLITHYQRLLNYIKPDHVHIMMEWPRSFKSGGPELASRAGSEGVREAAREKFAAESRSGCSVRYADIRVGTTGRLDRQAQGRLRVCHDDGVGFTRWLQHRSHKSISASISTDFTTRKTTSSKSEKRPEQPKSSRTSPR